MTSFDPSSSIKTLPGTSHRYHSLPDTAERLGINLDELPFSLRPILEGIARNVGKNGITVVNYMDSHGKRKNRGFLFKIMPVDLVGLPSLSIP